MPSVRSIVCGTSVDPVRSHAVHGEHAGERAAELVAQLARGRPVLHVDDRLVVDVEQQLVGQACGARDLLGMGVIARARRCRGRSPTCAWRRAHRATGASSRRRLNTSPSASLTAALAPWRSARPSPGRGRSARDRRAARGTARDGRRARARRGTRRARCSCRRRRQRRRNSVKRPSTRASSLATRAAVL